MGGPAEGRRVYSPSERPSRFAEARFFHAPLPQKNGQNEFIFILIRFYLPVSRGLPEAQAKANGTLTPGRNPPRGPAFFDPTSSVRSRIIFGGPPNNSVFERFSSWLSTKIKYQRQRPNIFKRANTIRPLRNIVKSCPATPKTPAFCKSWVSFTPRQATRPRPSTTFSRWRSSTPLTASSSKPSRCTNKSSS